MTAMQDKLREISKKQTPGIRRVQGKRYNGRHTPEMKESIKYSWAKRTKRSP